jgi:carbonic anhydrase
MTEQQRPRFRPRPDLGLRALLPLWRRALSRATLLDDALAGVGAVGPSFALALLIAQHEALPAIAALACAVVGSAVVALLGGTAMGLSGPGLAMGFAIVGIARDYGVAGLALATAITGAFQLFLGAVGVGRFARFVPVTIFHAFTIGVGGLVILYSLPHVFGLATPIDLDALHLIDHLVVHIADASLAEVALATSACAVTLLGARYAPRAPVALLALTAASVATGLGHFKVETLPDLPMELPLGPLPAVPGRDITQFIRATLVLFALATLETLLSAGAEEERVPGTRDDPDQELIGHGAANLLLSLLGGVPAAGSIVRAWGVRTAGGRTRAAALVHALAGAALIPVVLVADRAIPIAALAGVVVALAAPLCDIRPLIAVARISRAEAIVLAGTAFAIIFSDLLNGVEAGLAATLILAMLRVARFRVALHRGIDGAPHQIHFSGPITFLSVPRIEERRARLATLDPTAGVILDIRSVLAMDLTGCQRFLALVGDVVDRGGRVVVLGASPTCRTMLLAADGRALAKDCFAVGDRDVDKVLGRAGAFELRAHVVANLERFRVELRQHYTPLFDQLADGQHPHTLFITCVDSRIEPAMLTGSHPGELFILRCLGAMVTPPGGPTLFAEAAAVEYAIAVLGVRNVVICGHSQCGAVKAVKSGQVPDELASLKRWLGSINDAAGDLSKEETVNDAARAVTVRQLENLRKFSLVRERLDAGAIELHAWFYDVGQAELFEWDEAKQAFEVLGARHASEPPPALL